MSQMATETPPAPNAGERGQPRGGGNFLTRKIGPLPTWAWLLIGVALILGYVYYKNKTTAASSDTATGTDASQIPQFVNQVYTSAGPPTAPTPGPTPSGGKEGGGGTGPPTRVPLKREPGGKVRIGSRADLYYLAQEMGVSETSLLRANPRLRSYEGTGKGIPSGTVIKVPKGAKF